MRSTRYLSATTSPEHTDATPTNLRFSRPSRNACTRVPGPSRSHVQACGSSAIRMFSLTLRTCSLALGGALAELGRPFGERVVCVEREAPSMPDIPREEGPQVRCRILDFRAKALRCFVEAPEDDLLLLRIELPETDDPTARDDGAERVLRFAERRLLGHAPHGHRHVVMLFVDEIRHP